MQWERGVDMLVPSGIRKIHTFKKLPITIPKRKTTPKQKIENRCKKRFRKYFKPLF